MALGALLRLDLRVRAVLHEGAVHEQAAHTRVLGQLQLREDGRPPHNHAIDLDELVEVCLAQAADVVGQGQVSDADDDGEGRRVQPVHGRRDLRGSGVEQLENGRRLLGQPHTQHAQLLREVGVGHVQGLLVVAADSVEPAHVRPLLVVARAALRVSEGDEEVAEEADDLLPRGVDLEQLADGPLQRAQADDLARPILLHPQLANGVRVP